MTLKRKPRFRQLSTEELEVLLEKARKVQTYPKSIRCFEELFQEAYEILQAYGKRESLFSSRRIYLDHSRKVVSVTMTYNRNKSRDQITLLYGPDRLTIMGLLRERGCQSLKRFSEMDVVTMAMRGITSSEVLKGIRAYEPNLLIIEKDGAQEISRYQ